jgi:predicted TIM-barrel fold metal-dependent hydrolase
VIDCHDHLGNLLLTHMPKNSVPEVIERFIREVGAERVLFGSDIPLLEPAAALGRIAYARISEEAKGKILGLNIRQLLGA